MVRRGQGVRRQAGQSLDELPVEHRFGLVGLTLVQSLAAAEDHVEAGGQGNPYLLVDERIGFAQLVPASLCPRITYLQPTSRSIVGLTSPVNAPSFSG